MEAGRWRLNGETVKFSATGHLYDGQHRLNAVVQSGTTVPMVVIRGLGDDVMPTVDAGAKRSYSDALKLSGEENTSRWPRSPDVPLCGNAACAPTPELSGRLRSRWTISLSGTPEIRASADLASRLPSRERLPASVIGLCH